MDVFTAKKKQKKEKDKHCTDLEEIMTEIWDVYDKNGKKTGRTMERGIPKEGDYMLCVHMYLFNSKGEVLIQKRSKNKESHPGEWDITGGAALLGESGEDAVIRETSEEIGIHLSGDELYYVGRTIKTGRIIDVFFARKDFEISDCHIQNEEVDEIKFVSCHELLSNVLRKRGRKEDYIFMIKDAIGKMCLKNNID